MHLLILVGLAAIQARTPARAGTGPLPDDFLSTAAFARIHRSSFILVNPDQLKLRQGSVTLGKGSAGPLFEMRPALAAGTIAFQLQPVGWSGKDSEAVIFIELRNTAGVGQLVYKFNQPGVLRWYDQPTSGNLIYARDALTTWHPTTWHHVAMTWSSGQSELRGEVLVDGKRVGEFVKPIETETYRVARFRFGRLDGKQVWGGIEATLVRDMCLLPRVIAEQELAVLKSTPAGQIKSIMPPVSRPVLPLAVSTSVPVVDGAATDDEYTTAIARPFQLAPGEDVAVQDAYDVGTPGDYLARMLIGTDRGIVFHRPFLLSVHPPVVAVANWSAQPLDARVDIPPELGFAKKVVDMETGEAIRLGPAIDVTVGAHDLRVLHFR